MNRILSNICLIAVIFSVMLGCSRENDSSEVGRANISQEELEIQNDLKLAADWRTRLDFFHVRRLYDNIYHAKDGTLYANYIGKYLDVAFGIPVEAVDVGTRTRQFDSFATLTESAITCIKRNDHSTQYWNQYWKYALRRLEVIRNELKKIEGYVKGNGGEQNFSGVPKDWAEYYDRVRREYGYSKGNLTRLINNFLMVHVLPFEEWFAYLLRLETIVGEEIPIGTEPYRLWEEKQRKTNSASTNLVEVFRRVELYRAIQKENGRWSGRPGDVPVNVEGL